MNVYELSSPDLSGLRRFTRPDPRPGRGDVLIRLRAASLNFLDLAIASGKYPGARFPLVPVADGAGEIVELGAEVQGWKPGDRVIPHFLPDWQDGALTPANFAARRGVTRQGSLADYVVAPATSLVAVPESLDWRQAASLPVAATTAWRAVRSARPGPQSTVLLLGTGGVALFALQFARAHGARVIVTSSSETKLAEARALGADLGVNYRKTPAWDDEVLKLTDGRGADLVLETGGRETFPRSIKAAAPGAVVFVIGFLTGADPTIDVLPLMEKELRVLGNNTGPVAALREAVAAIAAHRLQPVIDRSFPFAEAAAAYRYAGGEGDGAHFGKVCIDLDR